MYIVAKSWGIAGYRGINQISAGVGMIPEHFLGRALTVQENRSWRKHGIISFR